MNLSLCACAPDDRIRDCAELVRARGLSMLAVVDDDTVVGVLGRNSLLSAGRSAALVRDVMSTRLVVCRPEDSVDEAAAILARVGGPAIFVADRGKVLGWLDMRELERHRDAPFARVAQ